MKIKKKIKKSTGLLCAVVFCVLAFSACEKDKSEGTCQLCGNTKTLAYTFVSDDINMDVCEDCYDKAKALYETNKTVGKITDYSIEEYKGK